MEESAIGTPQKAIGRDSQVGSRARSGCVRAGPKALENHVRSARTPVARSPMQHMGQQGQTHISTRARVIVIENLEPEHGPGKSEARQGASVKFTPVTCCAVPTVTACVAVLKPVALAAIV